jgi:hypothetical protein
MADWITNGESGSSVRAKLNSLTRPLAAGNLISPVTELVLAAPTGYYAFKFLFGDIVVYFPGSSYPTLTDPDNFAIQFSFDGGSTFEQGASDYAIQRTQSSGNGQTNMIRNNDAMAYLTNVGGAHAGFAMATEGLLYPGTASLQPYVKSDSMLGVDDSGSLGIYWDNISCFFNGAAGPSRITNVKVGPYFGDGATATFTYTLWGIPDVD